MTQMPTPSETNTYEEPTPLGQCLGQQRLGDYAEAMAVPIAGSVPSTAGGNEHTYEEPVPIGQHLSALGPEYAVAHLGVVADANEYEYQAMAPMTEAPMAEDQAYATAVDVATGADEALYATPVLTAVQVHTAEKGTVSRRMSNSEA